MFPLDTRFRVTRNRDIQRTWIQAGSLGTVRQEQAETPSRRAMVLVTLDDFSTTTYPFYPHELIAVTEEDAGNAATSS